MMTVLQRLTDDASRGRVFGAISAAEGVAVLVGIASAGVLGDVVGIIPVLVFQGLGFVVGGVVVLIRSPPPAAKHCSKTELRLFGAELVGGASVGVDPVDADPGDAAAVHLGDGEVVAVDRALVADRGDPAELGGEEAGDRLVRAVRELDPGLVGEVVQVEQTVHLDVAAAQTGWSRPTPRRTRP